jgi:hypothetical protein
MEFIALFAFLALVIGWLVAPNGETAAAEKPAMAPAVAPAGSSSAHA